MNTIKPYFIIPDINTVDVTLEDEWVQRLDQWLKALDVGWVKEKHDGEELEVVRGSDSLTMTPYAGDVLVHNGEDIYFATASQAKHITMQASVDYAEQDPIQQAKEVEPVKYELSFKAADGTTRSAFITADTIESNEHYLMFLRNGGLVQAMPHTAVTEFNSVAAHEENVGFHDSGLVSLEASRDAQLANRFMP